MALSQADSFHAPNAAITESGKTETEIENRLFIKKQDEPARILLIYQAKENTGHQLPLIEILL